MVASYKAPRSVTHDAHGATQKYNKYNFNIKLRTYQSKYMYMYIKVQGTFKRVN